MLPKRAPILRQCQGKRPPVDVVRVVLVVVELAYGLEFFLGIRHGCAQVAPSRRYVSAVICSEIKPIRKTITAALHISVLMFVSRPNLKNV